MNIHTRILCRRVPGIRRRISSVVESTIFLQLPVPTCRERTLMQIHCFRCRLEVIAASILLRGIDPLWRNPLWQFYVHDQNSKQALYLYSRIENSSPYSYSYWRKLSTQGNFRHNYLNMSETNLRVMTATFIWYFVFKNDIIRSLSTMK